MMLSLMNLKSIRIYVQNKGGRKKTQQMLSSPLRQYRGLVSDVRDLTPPLAHAHPAWDAMGTIAKVRRVTAGLWASLGEGQETSFQSTLRLSWRGKFSFIWLHHTAHHSVTDAVTCYFIYSLQQGTHLLTGIRTEGFNNKNSTNFAGKQEHFRILQQLCSLFGFDKALKGERFTYLYTCIMALNYHIIKNCYIQLYVKTIYYNF